MFNDDVKVAENEVCTFYSNSMTKGVIDWAKQWGINDIVCLIAAQKKNPQDKEYVLIRNNEFIYANTKYEAIGVHIDVIGMSEGKTRDG